MFCVFFLLSSAYGQTKYIHLRNGVITTRAGEKAAALEPGQTNSNSGLFLVQFEGHPLQAQQAQVRALGVDLLKYVPDDTFIARLTNASPDQVRALGFIRWVGPYHAALKVHSRLAATVQRTNSPVAVTILLSPRATKAEITGIRGLLASVEYESHLRQAVVVRGVLDPARLNTLLELPFVLWIEPAPHRKLIDEAASKLVGGDDGQVATPTVTEQRGFGGQGVIVCVADTGLDTGDTNTIHPDVRGRVTGFLPYPPLTDGSDGYGHGTHCAGIVAGNAATGETDPNSGQWYGLGVANQASLFIERIFDENANEVSPAPSDEMLTQDAVSNNAEIGSNSWGNDVAGEYDSDASQFDELVRDADSVTPGDQPYILEFSAGNAGPDSQTLDSPATGKNVIATGASENTAGYYAEIYGLYADGPDTIADFSSCGPCEDGRIKPDVVAPGTWIASMASAAAPNEAAVAWTVIDNYYVYMGGTSMSGPFAAGSAAAFVQYYKGTHTNAIPSPALVKAALINSASELDESDGGPGPIPNFQEGWGRVTLTNLIDSQRKFQMIDQTVLLTTGQTYQQHAFVGNSSQPLKITLAYTDVAGFPGAMPALVNDLDLVVIGPNGTVYRGNQFNGDESTPNAAGSDNLNNVEAVNLSQPLPGNYLIEVVAANVAEDARLDTAAIDQDFALVVSGPLLGAEQGAVLLDRTNYTAPGTINLLVLDSGRASSPTVSVLLKSTTESAGATFQLGASGGYGAFTGAVTTVVGPPAVAGKLEIRNGDAIEAEYLDSGGATDTAMATAVLNPPAISSVSATINLGVIDLTWVTSEPATSVVYYGTNQHSLNLVASDSTLTDNHNIELGDLTAGVTYYYMVVSSDDAGNNATNSNGGAFYDFVAVPTPPVLLVDDYDYANESTNGSTVIGAGAYTNALAATGYGYAYWNVSDLGPPLLTDLEPYRVVIWRTTDDIVNYDGTNNTLTPEQQTMIQTYLNNGGSFFMASMGILSQLGTVPFTANVLEVAGFVQNPNPPEPCDCDEYTGVPGFQGAAGDPITAGMNVMLDYTNYPSFDLGLGLCDGGDILGPDFGDTFTASTNSTVIAYSTATGKCCGMRFPPTGVDSPGRVVFLSFPLDAVPETGPTPDNETALLLSALKFLDPGGNGVGTVTLNNELYTIPALATVEVGDTALAGTGQTLATFSTSSFTNRLAVTLIETPHPGIFRGSVALVGASTNGPGQLRTRNGDTVSASYLDVATGMNVTATAVVQTNPPVITDVDASTNIGSAVVTWNTSEPADSLVQYEKGIILDRSAYVPALVTSHSVTLNGLASSSTYYFKVASRDQAGNSATDDNQGALFTFVTPKTLQPPWFDNLESGAKNWSVVPDPDNGTDFNWILGTPNDGLQTRAHSGVNAWGSDLNGTSISFLASSFLYSPVIDLTGFSSASLTFWDSFDFSVPDPDYADLYYYEQGQILISTNATVDPNNLPYVIDFSGSSAPAWEMETVDLSQYVGQPIQIVWDYLGFPGGNNYGWLVDDAGVTGQLAGAGGTVVVSRNIASGSFTLTGPNGGGQTGTGLVNVFSNSAPGQYIVQFNDVSFFNTPPPQTNTLLASNTLILTGTYTFPDVNSNGMSDLYEEYYFGSVSSNRTRYTDTDGDGMSDYAEFIAGTDPTNALSNLRFLTTVDSNNVVTFQWSAIPGRIYEVQTSTNLLEWTPVSLWEQAVASPMTYSWTNAADRARAFRVEVRP